MLEQIKRSLSRFKLKINYLLSHSDSYKSLESGDFKVVFFLSASYGNLGDVAISYAQREFLKKRYPEATYIEVDLDDTVTAIKSLKKKINDDDIITIVGGGNIGDMYPYIENRRRLVIRSFPNNNIVNFPQTIDFSEKCIGKVEQKISKRTYSHHKKLTIVTRESGSKEKAARDLCVDTILTPDIVLSLNIKATKPRDTNKLVICMRSDEEVGIGPSEKSLLIGDLSSRYEVVETRDTHIGDVKLDTNSQKNELDNIWGAFASSSLVLTDRLHGMIFCAITKTPCIALNNSNGKVKGVYDAWVKQLGGVVLLEEFSIESIDKAIAYLSKNPPKGTNLLGKSFSDLEKRMS